MREVVTVARFVMEDGVIAGINRLRSLSDPEQSGEADGGARGDTVCGRTFGAAGPATSASGVAVKRNALRSACWRGGFRNHEPNTVQATYNMIATRLF